MTQLRIPFDSWNMPVPVQVSQLVRDGDLAWSCGQCPLDTDGQVLFPGDLTAQAERVCDYIENVLGQGGLTADSVAKLVIYHAAPTTVEETAMLSVFRQRFGDLPLLVPVAVPHFYYDGMLIEVDVYAAEDIDRASDQENANAIINLEAVDRGDVVWVTARLSASDVAADQSHVALASMMSGLADLNLSPDDLLCSHWYWPEDSAHGLVNETVFDELAGAGVLPDRQAVVLVQSEDSILGELKFVRGHGCMSKTIADRSLSKVHARRLGWHHWFSGTCGDSTLGLVEQTSVIMLEIGQALSAAGLDFSNVVKSTTHYVGTASPEDLHENLAVRHSFYSSPGPASTGLPVAGLAGEGVRIAIDVLAITGD